MSAVRRWLIGVASWLLISAARCYQAALSPLLGGSCRFTPTCSQYFILAVQKHGPLLGVWKGTRRILRCHPFGSSGHDPP